MFLVGASGSGKSTFLRLALREERPTRGRIYVAGRDLSRMSGWKVPSLRRSIGMVFQDFRLLPNKTVYENVAFALEVIGRPRHVIKTTVPEVLEMVGLDGKEKRRPHELSGGEQQRVAIARAFVNRPPILLADEPTGNLDPTTSLGIMRLLERINRTGTTVVMATHDDEIVNEMRKRVVELSAGMVIRDEAAGVYGERERILPDVAASPVLDAPGQGERPAPRVAVTPEAGDLEAEAAAEAAAQAAAARAAAASTAESRPRRVRRAERRAAATARAAGSHGQAGADDAARDTEAEPVATLAGSDTPDGAPLAPVAADVGAGAGAVRPGVADANPADATGADVTPAGTVPADTVPADTVPADDVPGAVPPADVAAPSPAPFTYSVPAPYESARRVEPPRPPSEADDVVQQVLRERAVRTTREG
ncbi:hypothetical protein GCM10007967_10170 [Xylanimonas ulmi]